MRWIGRSTIAWLTLALTSLLVVIVSARRIMGSFEPLDAFPLALVAIGATCVVLTSRIELRRATWYAWPHFAPLIVLVTLAWAVSVPGSSALGLVSLWGLIACGECLFWIVWRRSLDSNSLRDSRCRESRIPDSLPTPPVVGRTSRDMANLAGESGECDNSPFDEEGEHDGLLAHPRRIQQTIRWHEEGCDAFQGEFRCAFAPHERSQALHVVFCPPFRETPELLVETLEGPKVEIKTTQLQPFGARLDLRLGAAASSGLEVAVQVVARAPL